MSASLAVSSFHSSKLKISPTSPVSPLGLNLAIRVVVPDPEPLCKGSSPGTMQSLSFPSDVVSFNCGSDKRDRVDGSLLFPSKSIASGCAECGKSVDPVEAGPWRPAEEEELL